MNTKLLQKVANAKLARADALAVAAKKHIEAPFSSTTFMITKRALQSALTAYETGGEA